MATHSSTLAWKIPWAEEPSKLQSMGSQTVRHDWVTSLTLFTFMHWRRKWQPTPVFLPGEPQGQRSLVGCRLWGHTESDTTEATWQQQHVHWVSDAIQSFHPLLPLLLLLSIFPSIRVFSSKSVLSNRWPEYCSFSFSIRLPMNIQGWFPLGLTGLISLLSKGLLRVFSRTTFRRHQFFGAQPFLLSSTHFYTWLLEKPQVWLYGHLSAVISLFFNKLSRFAIAFLPKSKYL